MNKCTNNAYVFFLSSKCRAFRFGAHQEGQTWIVSLCYVCRSCPQLVWGSYWQKKHDKLCFTHGFPELNKASNLEFGAWITLICVRPRLFVIRVKYNSSLVLRLERAIYGTEVAFKFAGITAPIGNAMNKRILSITFINGRTFMMLTLVFWYLSN